MGIPNRLIDNTTIYKHHTVYTHLFCIVLRCFIGLVSIFQFENYKYSLTWLSLLIFIGFGYKFIYNNHTWKVYLRTSISYIIVYFLLNYNKNELAGLLIIVDALLGIQSRHTATLIQ